MIPTTFDSRDSIPEAFVPFIETGEIVEGEGGAWKFADDAVQGMRPVAVVKEFRTNNNNLTNENAKLQETLKDLQDSYKGGMTASEAETADRTIQDLRDRLDDGESAEKVKAAVEKRMVSVKMGDREILVAKNDQKHFQKTLKDANTESKVRSELQESMHRKLSKGAIDGGTLKAIAEVGGFRENAHDAILDHVRKTFEVDDDFRPFKPDPESKPTNGDQPEALMSPDQKGNFSIADELREVKEGGKYTGSWTFDPSGPGTTSRAKTPRPKGEVRSGTDRISAGLAARGQ